jgi:NAD(P)-dependent dehydrogenase (short-subunit alcohol dehydrogenase family)
MTNRVNTTQQTVVVTGISSGIGFALAEKLLTSGYFVIGTVRSLADADGLVAGSHSKNFLPIKMDVTNPESIVEAVDQVKGHLGGRTLTALINNAGVSFDGPLMCQPMAEVRAVFEVNVFGLLAVTQGFLPLLGAGGNPNPERPGRVVNISSVSGGMTMPFTGAYSASKHAVEAITQAFRRELMPWGVEVVSIEPGFIRTDMFKKFSTREPQYASTVYAAMWERFWSFMLASEESAKPPAIVVSAVMHAIESKRPNTRYPLDSIWRISRLLPDRWFDKLLLRAFRFDKAN